MLFRSIQSIIFKVELLKHSDYGKSNRRKHSYTVRKEMKTILVSPDIGGQMLLTNEIENYPGFESVAGYELADKMEAQVRKYPVTIEYASVEKFRKGKDGTFTVSLDDGQELHGRTLIVTAGKRNRTLDIDGEGNKSKNVSG